MEMSEFFFGEDFRADPYPYYRRLREEAPVHASPLGGWAAVTADGVEAILHDPRTTSARAADLLEMLLGAREEPGPFIRFVRDQMVFRDPPDHTRLRRLVNKGFTPRAVEALRPNVERLVGELLREPIERGSMEVVSELAAPLPALVICEVLGVPGSDRKDFQRWSTDFLAAIDLQATPEVLVEAEASAELFTAYLEALIAETARNPRNDILSALVQAEEEGDALSAGEVTATAMLLLIAGYETTTNLLANGTRALATHPDQRAALAARAALPGDEGESAVKQAVEELLRYDAPVQLLLRTATESFDLCGTAIAEGDQLVACLGAANHDPARFADPDVLDIGRTNVRHLAFGHGIHFCLGAPLARLEGQVAFTAMLRDLGSFEITTDAIRYRDNFMFRALESLPVAW